MGLYRLPVGWKSFNDTGLEGLLNTINAMAGAIDIDAPAVEGTEDNEAASSGVDQLEALADAKDEVEALQTERADEAAAAEEKRSNVAARFAEPDPEDADGDDAGTGPESEMASDETDELDDSDDPETPEEDEAEELAAETDEPEIEAPSSPVDPAAVARAMASRRTSSELPATGSGVDWPMLAAAALESVGFRPGQEMNIDQVVQALADRRNASRGWKGARDFDYAVHSDWQFADGEMLGQAENTNYVVLGNARDSYQNALQANIEDEALVASGGPCAPLMPTYNFFQCFSPQRPLEAFLPTVGAPRGGIRFINPPTFAEALNAIDIKDATASASLPPAYTDKNCSRVSCPSETSITVAAISWCVTFDNLNFRVFPEQIRDFLERVQTMHTRAKEIYYLDRIDTLAGAPVVPTLAPAYGASRSLYRELLTIGHNYRKRNNMNTDAMLDILLPDVAHEILAIDMSNDASLGISVLSGPGGNMLDVLARKARLNVGSYYYDSTNGGFPSSEHGGPAGAWNDLPNVFRSYVFSPGSVVRLDAGTLDLGLVRDSALNRTNDVELFAEQWVEIANPGCELVAHDHTYCYDGTAPVGATALVCP